MNGVNNCLENCPICLNSYSDKELVSIKRNLTIQDLETISKGDQTPTQVKCGHIFHSSCLHQWIETFKHRNDKVSCPICREELMEHAFTCALHITETAILNALANAGISLNDPQVSSWVTIGLPAPLLGPVQLANSGTDLNRPLNGPLVIRASVTASDYAALRNELANSEVDFDSSESLTSIYLEASTPAPSFLDNPLFRGIFNLISLFRNRVREN